MRVYIFICAAYGLYGTFTDGLLSVYSLLAVSAIYAAVTEKNY